MCIRNKIGVELGPSHFEGLTIKMESSSLHRELYEWRAKLTSKFTQIKFYGDYINGRITWKGSIPQKVIAVSVSEDEILIFDGCKQGYNSLLCDSYAQDVVDNRKANQLLFPEGTPPFEIIVSAFYQADLDDILSDEVELDGMFTLMDGSLEKFTTVKRDAFDAFFVSIKDMGGITYQILLEELA